MTTTLPWFRECIGVPYSAGFRCWDFVRLVFEQRHGVTMPEQAAGVLNLKTAASVSGWRPVGVPAAVDDIVLMRNGRGERHVGVIVECNGRLGVLHNDGWLDAEGRAHGAVGFDDFRALSEAGCSRFEFWRLHQ